MTYLFIGGVADGQRLEVPETAFEYRVPNYSRMQASIDDRYLRYNYGGHFIFVFGRIEDVTAILLENYRPGEVINWFLDRTEHHTEAEAEKMKDYLRRGGRPDRAICLCPKIPNQ